MSNKIKITVLLFVVCSLLFVGNALPASAQSASVVITWQAQNFYPSDYQSKAAATTHSPILVSATALDNGKIANTSNRNYRWYVDGRLLQQGIGLKEVLFTPRPERGNRIFVRLVIESTEGVINGGVDIPIANPSVVVETRYPGRSFSFGEQIDLFAVPYFLNVESFSDISFFWIVNGKTRTSEGSALSLDTSTASVGNLVITSIVSNKTNPLESARTNLIINIK